MELHEVEIAKWENDYPFLDNVWQEFLDFNQDEILNVGDKEDDYHYGLCDGYEAIDSETGETNKRFCMKLLKNVASASDPETLDINGYERCSYVNMWLYFYTKHYHVEDNFIKKIFEMVNGVMQQYESYTKCEYESYRDFLEPENIIKLSMFTENLDKILDIISNTRHTHHFACRRYTYECANILKRMLKEHCTVNKDKNAKYVKTCAELDTFKDSYYDYLYEDQSIIEIIPNLEAPIRKFEEDLALEKSDAPVVAQNDFLSGSLKRNLATGAVAAAGTGALLLALNKFTPAGNMFRFGKRGYPRVSNFLDEGPSEKNFLNDSDYLNMDSDTMECNVGYTPTENY